MFGIFKKKQPIGKRLDARSHDILARAAAMIEMQLLLCKALPNYGRTLGNNFIRGYFIGFFDAAIQHANLSAQSDEDFFLLLATGHAYLFSGNVNLASGFTLESMSRQGDPDFDAAQEQGGEEYFACLEGRIRSPNGVERHFHGQADNA